MPLTQASAARKDRTTAQGGPELQHRHFAFIAATIADIYWRRDFGKGDHYRDLIEHFADACAKTNPKFDRKRFIAACND